MGSEPGTATEQVPANQTNPKPIVEFIGFTQEEIEDLDFGKLEYFEPSNYEESPALSLIGIHYSKLRVEASDVLIVNLDEGSIETIGLWMFGALGNKLIIGVMHEPRVDVPWLEVHTVGIYRTPQLALNVANDLYKISMRRVK